MSAHSSNGVLPQSDTRLWAGWLAIIFGLVGAATVLAFSLDVRTAVGLLTLALSLCLLAIRLEAAVYGIVAVTVILVDGWLINRVVDDVPFRMGLGRLYLMEIPIFLLFLGYLYRRYNSNTPKAKAFVSTPLDLPLKAWLLAFPVFAVYGLLLGHPVQDAVGYNEWRCLFIAIVFYFLVTSLFRKYSDLHRLWSWFFLLTTAKAFYSLFVAITKISPPLPLVFGQGPVGEGPENVMYLFAALPALAILLFHLEKDRAKRAILFFGSLTMVADVALSEKRDPQLALLIGLAVLAWHLPRPQKVQWVVRIGCVALFMAVSGFLSNLGSGRSPIDSSISRYNDILDFIASPTANPAEGSTFGFHVFDMIDGWEKIKERPILGQGFGGQTERHLTLLPIAWGGDIDTGVIHNQYLTFWLKMGITGPVLFLWLAGTFFYVCRRAVRRAPQTYGLAVVLGFCAAMWAEMAMEVWTAGLVGNTKTPIVVFLALALSVGFIMDNKLRTDQRARGPESVA